MKSRKELYMKTLFKKLISVVLVLTMVFSLSATAFAAEPDINQLERSMENITLDKIGRAHV